MRGDLRRQIVELGMMGFRHDQGVAGIDRVDVQERHGLIRLQDPGRRDLIVDDLAEDATRVVGWMSHDRPIPQGGGQGFNEDATRPSPTAVAGSVGLDLSDHDRRPDPTTAGLVGALTSSISPSRAITAIGAASPWRTLASL